MSDEKITMEIGVGELTSAIDAVLSRVKKIDGQAVSNGGMLSDLQSRLVRIEAALERLESRR